MTASLEPCRTKVARGEHHLADLDACFRRGLNEKLYGPVAYVDPKTRKREVRIEFPESLKLDFGVMVGDVVHNFRSALDHLIAQLAFANGKTPNMGHAFPLFERNPTRKPKRTASKKVRDAAHKERSEWGKYVSGIHKDAIAILKTLQPYDGTYGTLTTDLLALHELWNRDKHRVLNLAAVEVVDSRTDFGGATLTSFEIGGEDSASFYSATFADPSQAMDVNEEFGVQIVFSEEGPVQGKAVIPTLAGLGRAVSSTLDLFAPFF